MVLALALAACAGGPPPPQWRLDATSALDRAAVAYLSGDSRREASEFALARERIGRTGRPALLARIELMRCATRVASLEFGRCEGFEPLRADADPPERAYAAHLAAQALEGDDVERLPAAQQVAARALAGGEATLAGLESIDDPLARLIAVAVLFQAGKASPAMIGLAVDTASEQGWRRPLLAWLQVLALRAERAGEAAEAARLRRRIEVLTGAR